MNEPIKQQRYPLTQAQLRIWYTEIMNPDSTLAMLSGTLKIDGGPLDLELLRQSIFQIIRENDAFRIRIVFENNEPLQWFEEPENVIAECDTLEVGSRAEAEAWNARFNRIPIPVFDSKLYHIAILKITDEEHWVVFKFNHIILDGLSSDTMMDRVMEYYSQMVQGEVPASHAQSSYHEYLFTEQEYESSERFHKDREYWLNKFRTLPEVMGAKSYAAHSVSTLADRKSAVIQHEDYERLKDFSEQHGVSKYTLFLGVIYIYLYKVTGNEDIAVGTILANRTSRKEKETFGMFASTIATRVPLDPEQTLLSFLQFVSKEQKSDLRHQKYPYNRLIQDLRKIHPGMQELQDLFRVSMEYMPSRHAHYDQLQVRHIGNFCGHEAGDFLVDVYDSVDDHRIDLHLSYRTALYDEAESQRLMDQLLVIVDQILLQPEQKVRELSLLGEVEKALILNQFNPPGKGGPQGELLPLRFEAQVLRTPDQAAVVDQDGQLTYRELNERANRLARQLRAHGVGRESLVGILTERTTETLVGVMAVWKAGGAYVPLDPDYPAERIQFMLEDSGAGVLLTQSRLREQARTWPDCSGLEAVLCLDDESLYSGDAANLPPVNVAQDLAYVIYTSGTTGRPKGVMIEHGSLANTADAYRREYRLGTFDVRLLQLASFSFDVFVGDVARTLYNGGTMVICPKEDRIDPSRMYGWIRDYRINVFESTPALILPFMQYAADEAHDLSSMELLITSSDSCSVKDYRTLQERFGSQMRIINAYGVTEAAVDSSLYDEPLDRLPETGNVPIGRALLNASFYIVDSQLQPVPVGIPGELCIGGWGVARGYLNRPELSQEKFVSNPFAPGERMYRTGDLARWMPDGNVDFIGRMDNQVKIRGFRIELGEIESVMLRFDGVRQAVVVDRTDERGQKYLVGYAASEEALRLDELRAALKQALPAHMVPSRFMQVERLPLTPNGKVDRKSLPAPEGDVQAGSVYKAPTTPQEKKLAQIWQDVLGLEKVGVQDHFFDLGGHSLKATVLASRIQKEFSVDFPMRDIFRLPTVEEMARAIGEQESGSYEPIPVVPQAPYYPVSSAQKRLYILHQTAGAEQIYNMPTALVLEGQLEPERLQQAFHGLIARHESLRTGFELVDGDPVQRVAQEWTWELETGSTREEKLPELLGDFVRPFDLERPPLLRAGLYSMDNGRQLLIFDMHHIVCDGISQGILLEDLMALYQGSELPPQQVQYKDYSVWQNSTAQRQKREQQEAYWTGVLAGELPVLELPTDYARTPVRSFEGDELRFAISKAEVEQLQQMADASGATLYMVLLAAYTILLHKYSGQDDILTGTPVAGRTHADLETVVGMFVNTLAIRSYPDGSKTFRAYLEEIRETALQAFEHQDYPFEELLEQVQVNWEMGRNPLIDTMFVLQNTEEGIPDFGGLPAQPHTFKRTIAKFDITLEFEMVDGALYGLFEYCTKLFSVNWIDQLAQDLMGILHQILDDPGIRIQEISIRDNEEQDELLAELMDFSF